MKPIVRMENCYWIGKFESDFDFSDKKAYCIYASNGVMKTSFAKSFYDYQLWKFPCEEIFWNPTSFSVYSDGTPLSKNKVVVIKSYIDQYESVESLTTILVDQENRKKYDKAKKNLDSKITTFRVRINKLSWIVKNDIQENLMKDYGCDNIYSLLKKIDFSVLDDDLSNIKMSLIYNNDVLELLENPDIAANISIYVETYNKIISKNKFYKTWIFTPINAEAVLKSLKNQSFFDADNLLKLNWVVWELDLEWFQDAFNDSMEEIIKNPILIKVRDSIKKKTVIEFQQLIESNSWLLTKLEKSVIDSFKIDLWNSYFKSEEEFINELIEIYEQSITDIQAVEKKALEQIEERKRVVDIFKRRFETPYSKIDITNKKASAIWNEVPNLVFEFENPLSWESKELPRKSLDELWVLSQWEKRVLYLLWVIYDIEARKWKWETLFIIDDIADSFDYRNKYAIIQYLKEITDEENFYQIILTHNFDFFRTISMRMLWTDRGNCSLIVTKKWNELETTWWADEEILNPFSTWRSQIAFDVNYFVASIPYIRELICFKKWRNNNDYKKLTSLLHIKKTWEQFETDSILINDLKDVYQDNLWIDITSWLFTGTENIYEIIIATAHENRNNQCANGLIWKIILSIWIRLKAEKWMRDKISDTSVIWGNQRWKLLDRYKKEIKNDPTKEKEVEILESVNLMTPENIHFNSFMYEPIIDLWVDHLLKLFDDCVWFSHV